VKWALAAVVVWGLPMASAFSNTTLENSAAYVAGWLRALKADRRAVVFAAAAARKAADLIVGNSI
jgi:antirestriction protein ArdC